MQANQKHHSPIRVLLVDDHQMVRHGLVVSLATFDDLAVVGEAGTGLEAIQQCAEQQPDVVLMDLLMPEMDGISAIREIRQKYPAIQLIALTSFHDDDLVYPAIQAGAIGYLLKNVSIDELAAAIRAAVQGLPTLSPEATKVLVNATASQPSSVPNLTQRELEVLKLMSTGLNNREIAEQLRISRSTVKSHVSNILAKLDVSNRLEAVTLALQQKLVT